MTKKIRLKVFIIIELFISLSLTYNATKFGEHSYLCYLGALGWFMYAVSNMDKLRKFKEEA